MGEDDTQQRPACLSVPDPALPESGEGTGTLLERLAQVRTSLHRQRSEAPRLCEELLAQPREVQLGLVSMDPRYHTWGVCELLLARSQEAEPEGTEGTAEDAGHLARLALAASEGLEEQQHAPALVKDLRARSWAGVGEDRRRTGDLAGAEEALRAAGTCLAYGTGDLLVEARLLEFEAAVRADQGRSGEAVALLDQAADRYQEIRETRLLDRVLKKKEEVLAR